MVGLFELGCIYQFNVLFFDFYLWKFQVGGKWLVQKVCQFGVVIDGVVISVGILDFDEVVELIDELGDIGISYVVFKFGIIEQICLVICIVIEVFIKLVIMYVEGGCVGGYYFWEDFDDLLLVIYLELCLCVNIMVCVGGGIGILRRVVEYLFGCWVQVYGFLLMLIDGILVGIVVMVIKEFIMLLLVKWMFVDIQGID